MYKVSNQLYINVLSYLTAILAKCCHVMPRSFQLTQLYTVWPVLVGVQSVLSLSTPYPSQNVLWKWSKWQFIMFWKVVLGSLFIVAIAAHWYKLHEECHVWQISNVIANVISDFMYTEQKVPKCQKVQPNSLESGLKHVCELQASVYKLQSS